MTDLLEKTLDRNLPLRHEFSPDWDEVLARAGLASGAARPPRAKHALRRRRVLPLTAITIAAAAIAVAVALWPSGKHSVLDRALAAVGSRPIIHVVYRDEVGETLVDLTTGKRTPLYIEHEQWYDASRGLREVGHFANRRWQHVYAVDELPPQAKQTYAGILDGYRNALTDGTATLRGEDTLHGRHVFWIHLKGEKLFDVGDQRYHEWTHEIAIDAQTYRAVYVRETRDGNPGPGTGQEILSLETLPEDAVDFKPTPPERPQGMVMGITERADITADASSAASTALGTTPYWLGKSYGDLPLVRVERQALKWGPINAPKSGAGIELCYGRLLDSSADAPALCDTRVTHLVVQESREPSTVYLWNRSGAVNIPAGSLLVGWGGRDGLFVRNGVYVHIGADSEEAVIAAARALTPLK